MRKSVLEESPDQPKPPRRPLTHYRMPWGNSLKAASLVGFLGFATCVCLSVVLAFCIADPFTCTLFGIIFCASAAVS
jgi:uncharacterized membrane protein YesL